MGTIEVDELARVLFEKMETLEPTEKGDEGWDALSEHDKDFYRISIWAIIEALGIPVATNNLICKLTILRSPLSEHDRAAIITTEMVYEGRLAISRGLCTLL